MHRILGSSKTVGVLLKHQSTQFMRFSINLVLVSVSSIVIIGAGSLLRASIMDGNSSIMLSQRYFGPVSHQLLYGNNELFVNKNLTSAYASIESPATAVVVHGCTDVTASTSKYGNSIVNYLELKNLNSSFNSRSSIATGYGIDDYSGSSPQNLFLLQRMIGTGSCQINY
jgi:peptidoglycan L-alanyl-D-glutamate endopeptidase CwlK